MIIVIEGSSFGNKQHVARIVQSTLEHHLDAPVPILTSVQDRLLDCLRTNVSAPLLTTIWTDFGILGCNAWYKEWMYGRALATVGLRFILCEHSSYTYPNYARRYGWILIETEDPATAAYSILEHYISYAETAHARLPLLPPRYCGPADAPVVFVGESRNLESPPPAWLPFSSPMTTEFGRVFGIEGLFCGWTNVGDVPAEKLRDRPCIVSCGKIAKAWVQTVIKPTGEHLTTVHPSYLYRFNTPSVAKAKDHLLEIVPVVDKYVKPYMESRNAKI